MARCKDSGYTKAILVLVQLVRARTASRVTTNNCRCIRREDVQYVLIQQIRTLILALQFSVGG